MSIVIFIVILVFLIVVHELGHFAAAKFFGIRVDEFGIGFPPLAWGKKFGETLYSINWLPFGGFVKIFGEDGQSVEGAPDAARSIVRKNRAIQAAVLVAGVFMNIIAAWLILSAGYMVGLPTDSDANPARPLQNITPTIVEISPDSPAAEAGILPGDRIVRISSPFGGSAEAAEGADAMRAFIAAHPNEELQVALTRGKESKEVSARPSTAVEGAPEGKAVLGVAIVDVGILKLPVHLALVEGAKLTYTLTIATAEGLGSFAKGIFTGKADFSEVSGPVGIVGVVDDAEQLGLAAVLSLAAVISVNLAIINLVPFPALDGGRLLVVAVEAVRRRAINPNLFLWLNAGGFAALILLMLVVTYHDIVKLFI